MTDWTDAQIRRLKRRPSVPRERPDPKQMQQRIRQLRLERIRENIRQTPNRGFWE